MIWSGNMDARLEEGLHLLGIVPRGRQLDQLGIFAREVLLWNPTHGLVGVSGQEDLAGAVLLHILDSLSPLEIIAREAPLSLADVGSGGGFPGIPLAVMLEDTRMVLVEKMGRRCDFLRNAAAITGLKDKVRILQQPLDKVEESFEGVTLRAFSPLPRVLSELFRITLPGGKIYAYKGRADVIAMEMEGTTPFEIHPLKVPFLEGERHLVVLQKPGKS